MTPYSNIYEFAERAAKRAAKHEAKYPRTVAAIRRCVEILELAGRFEQVSADADALDRHLFERVVASWLTLAQDNRPLALDFSLALHAAAATSNRAARSAYAALRDIQNDEEPDAQLARDARSKSQED